MTHDFLPFNCGERISALTGSFNYFAPRWRPREALASVTMIVQEIKVSPVSGFFHLSHSPANARSRHVNGRLASLMRWDKHICSEAVWLVPEGSSGLSRGLPYGLAAPYSISDAVCCTWAGRCRRGCRGRRLAMGRSGIALCHAHVPLPAAHCVLALDGDLDRNLRLDRLPVGSRSLVLQA